MHETSIAKQILAAVLARVGGRASRIRVVHGWVAESESLSPESLAFHFSAHATGTPAEGARLERRLTRVEARCQTCGATYRPEYHLLVCPDCGSVDGTLLGRTGLGIDTVEID